MSLKRYFLVVDDSLPARFRVCKRVPIEIDLESEEEELWNEHDRVIGKLRDTLRKVDEGKIELDELEAPERSLLDLKVALAKKTLASCHFCERRCHADRRGGEVGFCEVGEAPRVASSFVHRGEEPELVPSFTIFFSGCTFECQFCQNWDISQNPKSGPKSSPEEISSSISAMRRKGVRNVNWVGGDPTPNLHNVLTSLNESETNIPSVWNSNLYLSSEGMKLLSGTQDVYLTDFKYGNNDCALKYSKAPDYWGIISRNHKLAFDDAEMIIRHLVLPNHVECCTKGILEWIGAELNPEVRVNLMNQYRPMARAGEYPEISRHVSSEEMNRALEIAEEVGLENILL